MEVLNDEGSIETMTTQDSYKYSIRYSFSASIGALEEWMATNIRGIDL